MLENAENGIQSWLDLQCQLLVGTRQAVVLFGGPGIGPVLPAATWPKAVASSPALSNAAASALHQGRIVVRAKDSAPVAARQKGDIVAVPILRDKDLVGVVSVELEERSPSEQQVAAKMLARNTVWLNLLMRKNSGADDTPALAVVDLSGKLPE